MLGDIRYRLDIRPTFVDELDKAVAYIDTALGNPIAADRLIEDVYAAIENRLFAPLSTAPVYAPPDVVQPYYRINVRNFSVYYIVIGDVMEVRWFRYARSVQPLSPNPDYLSGDPFSDAK